MLRKFDLIVIGTGSAASTVAYECRKAGWEVAIIDSRPFGGTCARIAFESSEHFVIFSEGTESLPVMRYSIVTVVEHRDGHRDRFALSSR